MLTFEALTVEELLENGGRNGAIVLNGDLKYSL